MSRAGTSWTVILLVVCLLVFRLAGSLYQGQAAIASYIYDDGFYYLKIAEHIAAGDGSTFDGTSMTSGYQPLWEVTLIPFAALTSSVKPETGVMLFLIWTTIWYTALAVLLWRFLSRRFGAAAANLGVAALAFAKVSTLFTGGVEAPLLGILLLLLIEKVEELHESKPMNAWPWLVLGVLGGCVVLARLDHVFIAAPLMLYATWSFLRLNERVRSLLLSALPAVMIVSMYFCINWIIFGNPLPISGANKISSAFDTSSMSFASVLRAEKSILMLTLLPPLSAILLGILLLARSIRRPAAARTLLVWSLSTTLYHVFIYIAVADPARWYFVSSTLLLCGMLAWVWSELVEGRFTVPKPVIYAGCLAIATLIILSHAWRLNTAGNEHSSFNAVYRMKDYCAEHLPQQSVIAICDAGHIGFVFDQRVMNADGLVNNWEYLRAYREGRALDELKERGATHLMTCFGHQVRDCGSDRLCYTLHSPMGINPANTDTFAVSDLLHREAFESTAVPDGQSEMLIWELK
jgi:hypothetical protein